jgi:hypothetical protein
MDCLDERNYRPGPLRGRISGRERDDAGDLPVNPGRDLHITGGDVFWDDLEGGRASIFLQRGVRCEPDFRGESFAPISGSH